MKLITTSWDDGNIADFRLAELLEKYNLQGTFYIPASNTEHDVMTEKEIVALSDKFEIGGHTMNHTSINNISNELFDKEIKGCYTWLTNLIGEPPKSFCFPRGVYNRQAVDYAIKSGFEIIRTTELLNPWFDKNDIVIPTTMQLFRHSELTYYKHLLKRFKIKSILLFLKSGSSSELQHILEYYLNYILKNGGCFHLWGHSWEIEEFNLWADLENLFRIMSDIPEFEYVNNKTLLQFKNVELIKQVI
jgi:peptidoglycan/xylan/chitin deacetylase (PgdA/CDA1 family)